MRLPLLQIQKLVSKPKEEWIRVEGTHEAIISQEDFQLAARLKEKDTRKAPGTSAVYPLSGLVCCGDCKSNMVRKTCLYGDKTYGYFVCARPPGGQVGVLHPQYQRGQTGTGRFWRGLTFTSVWWRSYGGHWRPSAAVPCSG